MAQPADQVFQQGMQQIETLIDQIEVSADPAARESSRELVQALLDLHGAGLGRIMAIVAQAGAAGEAIVEQLTRDELVASLLMLHELHPQDLETRVGQALATVRPYLGSHGGDVELLGVDGGVVRLRLQGSCHGCPSSAMTLKLAIEEAIYKLAPDVLELAVEGLVDQPAALPLGVIPLEPVAHSGRVARATS